MWNESDLNCKSVGCNCKMSNINLKNLYINNDISIKCGYVLLGGCQIEFDIFCWSNLIINIVYIYSLMNDAESRHLISLGVWIFTWQ